jgi:hypothetical protein
LKEITDSLFFNVSGELYMRASLALVGHGLQIARCLRMIGSGDHEVNIRDFTGHDVKCLDHRLESLVCAPFAECENAVLRIPAAGEIRILRPSGKDSMTAHVNRPPAVLLTN